MKELLDTLDAWQADGRRHRPGRRRPDVRLRAAARGRRPAVRGRRPDRRLGQRRLRRGRRGRGDRARPAPAATRGSSATASATSRPGTWGWPAAARSTSWSSRSRRPLVIDGGPSVAGRRRARLGGRSRHSPPIRRRATFGPHEPGEGAPPAPELVVHDDGRLEGTLGSPELDARAGRRRPARRCSAACRGPSSSAAGRCSSRSSRSGRGSSSSAPSRSRARSSASRASSASRPSSSMAARRSRRPSASPTSIA